MSTATSLVTSARNQGLHITTAESCTGGLLSAAITAISGASDVFDFGFVTYSNAAKRDLLGVKSDTLKAFGAVSNEIAIEMATGALKRAKADISLAITGIAGPGGSEYKPEGRVCFALAQKGQPPIAQTIEFGPLGRENVRRASTKHALEMLNKAVS